GGGGARVATRKSVGSGASPAAKPAPEIPTGAGPAGTMQHAEAAIAAVTAPIIGKATRLAARRSPPRAVARRSRIIETSGAPPAYRRHDGAVDATCPATSTPSIRIVGEPQPRAQLGAPGASTSISSMA